MEFQLFDGDQLVTSIDANNEKDAWKKLNKVGFRNRNNLYTLIEGNDLCL